MNKLFEIQTLSDRNYGFKNYSRLGDPVAIIAGIATVIPSLFPNLFGSERLTMDHLNKLFPSNGFWTNKYKNHLLSRIKYLKDVSVGLHHYTGEFIEQNLNTFCPGVVKGGPGGQECWKNFYKVLQQENVTGGHSPVGNVLGAGIDYQTILLIGGGVLLLSVLLKKKRARK